jgi:hypothetical protein
MSESRLHAFPSRRRGARLPGHACLLTCACQVLARVFGPCSRVSQLPKRTPSFFTPFDAADSSCQIRTEQTAVDRLAGKAPHRTQAEVDRSRR